VTQRGPFGQKKSASADAARQQEVARVWAMTARERALLALRLGRRFRASPLADKQPR